MDIHKLEVDESQINKATGRIILPESDLPTTPRPQRPHPTTPRVASAVPHPSEPAAQQKYFPQPNPSSLPSWVASAAWGAGALLVSLAILALLMWSSGQLRQSMEALRSESMRQQAVSDKVVQHLTAFSKDIATLQTIISELRAETLHLGTEIRQLKQQLDLVEPAAPTPQTHSPALPTQALPRSPASVLPSPITTE